MLVVTVSLTVCVAFTMIDCAPPEESRRRSSTVGRRSSSKVRRSGAQDSKTLSQSTHPTHPIDHVDETVDKPRGDKSVGGNGDEIVTENGPQYTYWGEDHSAWNVFATDLISKKASKAVENYFKKKDDPDSNLKTVYDNGSNRSRTGHLRIPRGDGTFTEDGPQYTYWRTNNAWDVFTTDLISKKASKAVENFFKTDNQPESNFNTASGDGSNQTKNGQKSAQEAENDKSSKKQAEKKKKKRTAAEDKKTRKN